MKTMMILMTVVLSGCSLVPPCEKYELMVWTDYKDKTTTQYYGCVKYAK